MSRGWNSLGALDLSVSVRQASRPRARMSGQGQTQHIHDVQDESVLPLIATESLHCGSILAGE